MNLEEIQALAIDALEDMKGMDIKVVDVRGKSSVTDILVFASGNSSRQVSSMAGNVVERAKQAGLTVLGTEGEAQGEWVLVDLGEVVVHVMRPEVREFYQIEKLWSVEGESEHEQANA